MFFPVFFLTYLMSPRLCHSLVGYIEVRGPSPERLAGHWVGTGSYIKACAACELRRSLGAACRL